MESELPANRHLHSPRGGTGGGTTRSCPVEELRVVEFRLVREDVRVGVRGDREIALPDLLADASPRHSAQVEEADAAVPEVVRREPRDAGGPTRLRDRRPQRVGTRPGEEPRIGIAVLARPELQLNRVSEDRV